MANADIMKAARDNAKIDQSIADLSTYIHGLQEYMPPGLSWSAPLDVDVLDFARNGKIGPDYLVMKSTKWEDNFIGFVRSISDIGGFLSDNTYYYSAMFVGVENGLFVVVARGEEHDNRVIASTRDELEIVVEKFANLRDTVEKQIEEVYS